MPQTSQSAMMITLSPPEYQSNKVITYIPACKCAYTNIIAKSTVDVRKSFSETNDMIQIILCLRRLNRRRTHYVLVLSVCDSVCRIVPTAAILTINLYPPITLNYSFLSGIYRRSQKYNVTITCGKSTQAEAYASTVWCWILPDLLCHNEQLATVKVISLVGGVKIQVQSK